MQSKSPQGIISKRFKGRGRHNYTGPFFPPSLIERKRKKKKNRLSMVVCQQLLPIHKSEEGEGNVERFLCTFVGRTIHTTMVERVCGNGKVTQRLMRSSKKPGLISAEWGYTRRPQLFPCTQFHPPFPQNEGL